MKTFPAALLAAFAGLAFPAAAATKTWNGSQSGSWANGMNWTPSGAPADGDSLVFPDGVGTKSVSLDNGTVQSFTSITFSGGGYNVNRVPNGSGLTFTGSLSVTSATGNTSFDVPFVLASSATVSVANAGASLNLTDNIGLNGLGVTLTVTGAGDVVIAGVVNLAGGLSKSGTGTLSLGASNSYFGTTSISGGNVVISNANALGGATNGTAISGGTLRIGNGITLAEPLDLSGSGFTGAGALVNLDGDNVLTAPITLTATATIGLLAGTLDIQSAVSGSGGLTVSGSLGTSVILEGANTYAGATSVDAGNLDVLSSGGLGSAATGTTVASGAALRLASGLSLNEPITIAGPGSGGFGALAMLDAGAGTLVTGAVTLTANATLSAPASATLVLSGVVSGAFQASFGTATSTGTVALLGNNTYGSSNVFFGTLRVEGSQPSSSVLVHGGATLSGSGTVGDVTVNLGGHLSPGASPGQLSVGSLTLQKGALLDIQLNGTTAGTQYDQVTVGGSTLSISLSDLSVTLGFTPSPGATFDIVPKTSAGGASGTFAGLAQGDGILVSGTELVLDYAGGSGANDIVLTAVPTLAVSITPGSMSSCGAVNVLLTANPSGGSGSYSSYQWNRNGVAIGGATAATYNATQSGAYTVTVTDSAGITSAESAPTNLGDSTSPTVMPPAAATITQTTCQ